MNYTITSLIIYASVNVMTFLGNIFELFLIRAKWDVEITVNDKQFMISQSVHDTLVSTIIVLVVNTIYKIGTYLFTK